MGDDMSQDLTTAIIKEITAIKDYEFAAAEERDTCNQCINRTKSAKNW